MEMRHKYTEVPWKGPGIRNWRSVGDPHSFSAQLIHSSLSADQFPLLNFCCRWKMATHTSLVFSFFLLVIGSDWPTISVPVLVFQGRGYDWFGWAHQSSAVRGQGGTKFLSPGALQNQIQSAFDFCEELGMSHKMENHPFLFPSYCSFSEQWFIVDFAGLGDADF